jgi:hypothetical protein
MKFEIVITALLFFVTSNLHGQYFKIDTIYEVIPHTVNELNLFPIFVNKNNPPIADSINCYLVKENLRIDLGKEDSSIYTNVNSSELDSLTPSAFDISFDVLNNDSSILCVGISGDGMGAYISHFTNFFCFDSRTGKTILINTLFTDAGLSRLMNEVVKARSKRIRKYMNDLRKSTTDKTNSAEDKQYAKDALDGFDQCITESIDPKYVNYSLHKKTLSIYVGPCLPHYNQALDDVDYSFQFDLDKLKSYFSNYGRILLYQLNTTENVK